MRSYNRVFWAECDNRTRIFRGDIQRHLRLTSQARRMLGIHLLTSIEGLTSVLSPSSADRIDWQSIENKLMELKDYFHHTGEVGDRDSIRRISGFSSIGEELALQIREDGESLHGVRVEWAMEGLWGPNGGAEVVCILMELDQLVPGILPEYNSSYGKYLRQKIHTLPSTQEGSFPESNTVRAIVQDMMMLFLLRPGSIIHSTEWYENYTVSGGIFTGHDQFVSDCVTPIIEVVQWWERGINSENARIERDKVMKAFAFWVRSMSIVEGALEYSSGRSAMPINLVIQSWLWGMPVSHINNVMQDTTTDTEVEQFWNKVLEADRLIGEDGSRNLYLVGWEESQELVRRRETVENSQTGHMMKCRAWWNSVVVRRTPSGLVPRCIPEIFLWLVCSGSVPDCRSDVDSSNRRMALRRLCLTYADVNLKVSRGFMLVGDTSSEGSRELGLHMQRYSALFDLCPMVGTFGIIPTVVGLDMYRSQDTSIIDESRMGNSLTCQSGRLRRQNIAGIEVSQSDSRSSSGRGSITTSLRWPDLFGRVGTTYPGTFGDSTISTPEWYMEEMGRIISQQEETGGSTRSGEQGDFASPMEVSNFVLPSGRTGRTSARGALLVPGSYTEEEERNPSRSGEYRGYTRSGIHSVMFDLAKIESDVRTVSFGNITSSESHDVDEDTRSALDKVKAHIEDLNTQNQEIMDGWRIRDGQYDFVVSFRVISGHPVWFNSEQRLCEIGPSVRRQCWRGGRLANEGGNVLRFIGTSTLGTYSSQSGLCPVILVARGTHNGEMGRISETMSSQLGGTVVLPDELWDAMSELFKRGIALWPTLIDPLGVHEGKLPRFNGWGMGRCRGTLSRWYDYLVGVTSNGVIDYRDGGRRSSITGSNLHEFSVSYVGEDMRGLIHDRCPQPWEAMAVTTGRATDELSEHGVFGLKVDPIAMASRVRECFPDLRIRRLHDDAIVDWVTTRLCSRFGVMAFNGGDSLYQMVVPHRTKLGIWTWRQEFKEGNPVHYRVLGNGLMAIYTIHKEVLRRRLMFSRMSGPGTHTLEDGGVVCKGEMLPYEVFRIAYHGIPGVGFDNSIVLKSCSSEGALNGGRIPEGAFEPSVLEMLKQRRLELLGLEGRGDESPEAQGSQSSQSSLDGEDEGSTQERRRRRAQETRERIRSAASVL